MTFNEILNELRELTEEFTVDSGTYRVEDKGDVRKAVNILNKYYTNVNSGHLDYKNKEVDGTDYLIEFDTLNNEAGESMSVNESLDDKVLTSSDVKAAKLILKKSMNPKEIELAQKTLKKYSEQQKKVREAIEKHDELNPKLWDGQTLKPEVEAKLREIVQKFDDNLKDNDVELDVKDICIIGSNANYNYSPDSDVDLHIVADTSVYPDQEDLAMKVYLAYKSLFNNKYDPTINGIEVEIYVEPDAIQANSNGIYSLNDGWLKEPEQVDVPDIDPNHVQELIQPYEERYNELINGDPTVEDVDKLIDDIYLQRQSSIMKDGEFGDGNICFKEFRNRGYLQKSRDLKVELENKEMSLNDMNEQLLDIYGLNEGCDDHIDEGLTSSDLFIGAEFVNPEDRVKIVVTDISDDLVTYEESQGDSDAFTVTDPVSYFVSMLNEYDYVLDENCNKDLKEDVFENENGMEISFPDPRDTLAVFLEWEGIIGYTDEIYDVAQEGYDALDEYLEYEGILGYTDKIYNIINNNSVWCSQMEMEDFISVCKALYIDYTLAIDDDIDESLKEGTSFDSTPGFMSPEEIRAKELADKEKANAEKEQIKAQKSAERKEKAKDERARQRRIEQREAVDNLSYDSLADMAGLDEDNNDLTKDELLAVLRSNMSDAEILKMHKRVFEALNDEEFDKALDTDSYNAQYESDSLGAEFKKEFDRLGLNIEDYDSYVDMYRQLDQQGKEVLSNKIKSLDASLNEDAPAYAVKYITGYAGMGVNHTETKFFRTKEEQEKFVNELKDRNATGIETYTVDNFYHDKQEKDKKNLYLDTLSEDFVISDTPGTEYVNTNGIIIRMTEPTTEGELQLDIVENGNVIDHRKVSDLKSLARIIDANGYKKINDDCDKDLNESHKDYDLIFDRDTGDRRVEYGINWIQFFTDNHDDAVRWVRQLSAAIAGDFENGEPSDDPKYYNPENYPGDIQRFGDREYNFRRPRDILARIPKVDFIDKDDEINEAERADFTNLEEAIDDSDDVGKTLADYLGTSLEDMDYLGNNIYDTPEGEYFVSTEEEAHKTAVQNVKDILDDDGVMAFTPSFRQWIVDNAIDEKAVDKVIDQEIKYFELEEDDPDMLEFLRGLDTYDEKISYVNDLYADSFDTWATDFVDKDKVAEEAVSEDGIAHFLAYYDGEEIDLPNNLKAYRIN